MPRLATQTQQQRLRSSGYTLIELLLAMAIFSFVLIIMVTGVIRLVNFYQSSVNIRITQETARQLSNDLTQAAQQSYLITADSSTTTTGGYGSQPESAVCFFIGDDKRIDANDIVGQGYVYYATPIDAGANEWVVKESSFSNLQTALTGATTCASPDHGGGGATFGSGNQVSPSDASLVRFAASATSDGRLASFDMVIGGTTQLSTSDVTYPPAATVPTCIGTSGDASQSRYCAMTRLQMSADARENIQS